ncbi:hypothetical protein NM688_g2158 [Phlebia brevispora]|uniref:Uncharacterized protein n=1 Tax=Phlebia brevispora TaxID=194682 RepID=A0ACC1T930_9APHY|nr:hypothetical protein NM688_g2158 [Phlebia brevispora]
MLAVNLNVGAASSNTTWRRICDNQGGDPKLWKDTFAAAVTEDSKYIVTAPNCSFVPEPLLGSITISIGADGHFGSADPIHWPQILEEGTRYPWLPCVERQPPVISYPDSYLWFPLSEAQVCPIQPRSPSSANVFCTVQATYLAQLRVINDRVKYLVDSFESLYERHPELRWLFVSMRDAFDQLDYPATYRDLVRQHACFQRFTLYTYAWLQWHVVIKRTYKLSAVVPLRSRDMMEVFVIAPKLVQLYFDLGVPVWFLRTQNFFKGDEVVRSVVLFERPKEILSFPDKKDLEVLKRELVGRVSMSMNAGEPHLNWIHYQAAHYVDMETRPYPETILQLNDKTTTSELTPLLPVPADRMLLSSEASGSRPVQPEPPLQQPACSQQAVSRRYSSPEQKRLSSKKGSQSNASNQAQSSKSACFQPYPARHIPPSEQEKYKPFSHEYLPPPISTWEDALTRIKLEAFQGAEPWGYWVPEPRVLVNTKEDERHVRYIGNWLRVRDIWFSLLLDHLPKDGLIGPLKILQWRDYLNTSAVSNTEMLSKKGKRQNELREVYNIFKKVLKHDILQVDLPRTWLSLEIPSPKGAQWVHFCRQVVWEISEVGFQYELTRLDQHLLPGGTNMVEDTHRRDLIAAVFPQDRGLILRQLPTKNDGLAAVDMKARTEHLQALKRIISRWPDTPDYIRRMIPFKSVNDVTRFAEMERALVEYYCQKFYDVAGRPPILPRLLY